MGNVYRERAALVAVLAALYPAVYSYNDPKQPDWLVVYIQSSKGQLSWHISPEDLDLFKHIKEVPPEEVIWDGHTTEEKYARISALVEQFSEE